MAADPTLQISKDWIMNIPALKLLRCFMEDGLMK